MNLRDLCMKAIDLDQAPLTEQEVETLAKTNLILIEALEFYANRDNWLKRPCHVYIGEYFAPVFEEAGKPAVKAIQAANDLVERGE